MNARNVDINGKPTVISTFSGCGGSSLGYKWAGFREFLAIDFDENSVETFKLNFPDIPVWQRDINDVKGGEIIKFCKINKGELDLLDGSPPCQGFSTAGKRRVNDPRNSLFESFVRLINDLQPKVFVMENVSGMIKGRMKGMFLEVDGAGSDEPLLHEVGERPPELDAHKDDGVVADLAGLDERGDFEHLVHRAEAAREGDEGVGVLREHHLADEEVAELDEGIEVGIGFLFAGELDVAADGIAARLLCPAVGGFHQAGSSTSHDGETFVRDGGANLAAEPVVGMAFAEPRRTEDGDAGTDEVEPAEPPDELESDAHDAHELRTAVLGAFEEVALVGCWRAFPPLAVSRKVRGDDREAGRGVELVDAGHAWCGVYPGGRGTGNCGDSPTLVLGRARRLSS